MVGIRNMAMRSALLLQLVRSFFTDLHLWERLEVFLSVKKGRGDGEWRKLHNEQLNDPYSLLNIVRVVKIEKNEMGWACGAYGGGERSAQGVGGET
jgi:hypothetical protein